MEHASVLERERRLGEKEISRYKILKLLQNVNVRILGKRKEVRGGGHPFLQ
jgi:hypothetical protein